MEKFWKTNNWQYNGIQFNTFQPVSNPHFVWFTPKNGKIGLKTQPSKPKSVRHLGQINSKRESHGWAVEPFCEHPKYSSKCEENEAKMQSNSEVLCCEGRRDKIFITTARATACCSGLNKLRFCNCYRCYRGRPLSFLNAPSLSHCSLSLKRKHALPGKLDDKQKRLEANQQVQQTFFYTRNMYIPYTTCRAPCLQNFKPNLPTKGNDAGANGSPDVLPTVPRHGPSAFGAGPCFVDHVTVMPNDAASTWWYGM